MYEVIQGVAYGYKDKTKGRCPGDRRLLQIDSGDQNKVK
jgi:hypothetical protein